MITTTGKTSLINFFMGLTGQPISHIALGLGGRAPVAGDYTLQFEAVRTPVLAISRQPDSDLIVFRGTIQPRTIGFIYEVGLFSNTGVVDLGRNLNFINPDMGVWTSATLSSDHSRMGSQTLRIDFSANGTTGASLTGLTENLSEFDANDHAVMAYYATANLSSVRFRFGLDASNYFEFIHSSPSVGYNMPRFVKSAATVVGAPSWDNIAYMSIRPSGTAAGGGSVYADAIRFENRYDNLVARYALAAPIAVDQDIVTDVEYALNLRFSDAE